VQQAPFLDLQEPQVQQEQQVLQEQLDHKALQEMSDLLVLLVQLAPSVLLEISDQLDQQVQQDLLVQLDRLVLQDQQV
jgi:hypothetical protein